MAGTARRAGRRVTVGISAGDPTGIGPEVVLRALRRTPPGARVVVIGDRRVFAETARRLGRPGAGWRVIGPGDAWPAGARRLLLHVGRRRRFVPGRPSPAAGAASLAYLRHAVRLARAGALQALVTAPVTKWAIERSGTPFRGQTDYLARALRARRVATMFVAPRLRLVLLTRHLPVRRVAAAVTARTARQTLAVALEGLQRHFGLRRPRIAVCGLNPHAGEGGLFGREEHTVLRPAMAALRRRGVRWIGPVPADGFFARPAAADAVVCWYHDQGLIPFKMLARGRGCQVTLGLPVVRTSPDHGSAHGIAGRGRADPGSMRYALALAVRLARRTD
jgi:4-hydroxythreonine-4-phosphate dehydrogenase